MVQVLPASCGTLLEPGRCGWGDEQLGALEQSPPCYRWGWSSCEPESAAQQLQETTRKVRPWIYGWWSNRQCVSHTAAQVSQRNSGEGFQQSESHQAGVLAQFDSLHQKVPTFWWPENLIFSWQEKENINSEEHERLIVKQGCYLTGKQLLGGCQQRLNHSRGQQICHNLSRKTLSSDEGLGLPVTIWLFQKQKLLQNTVRALCTYLIECTLQLLERIT